MTSRFHNGEGRYVRISFEFEAGDSLLTLAEYRRRSEAAYLKYVVERHGGRRGMAALVLDISRKNLWERLRALGLEGLAKTDEDTRALAEDLRRVTSTTTIAA